ncbi:hypothetical protein [Pseudobutyrivibrio xylanivorans]|uniref:Nucleotidyltransferase n=1 Tax=Pseudobutyrivibrio xylanivorans DSM 14809 TaxID=1123012 RepID=A0A1M6JVF5_PSEXY|nr:hypothetical protein [Pseudobutyrivibrio xylanivorans]SHJ50640.1 hypothetical protein SAMN02745725_02695 [Pseudobutyrivibrio xylanivorans DSM 14809]
MYHYVEDKVFLHESYSICADLVNQLVQHLKHYDIESRMTLVGSGKRNMVTQNGNEPIDYDFNLILEQVPNFNDCRYIKETVMDAFNEVLDWNRLDDCRDSKSVITTQKIHLRKGNRTEFSIDICIVRIDQYGYWHRLIHDKTGCVQLDRYFWNQGPSANDIHKKELYIKSVPGLWQEVRRKYLEKKNGYLRTQNYFHPSFNCYIEAINEVYAKENAPRNMGFRSIW